MTTDTDVTITAYALKTWARCKYVSNLPEGKRKGCHVEVRLPDSEIEARIEKIRSKTGLTGDDLMIATVDSLVIDQGGWLIFIDDDRTIDMVTSELGVFLVARNWRESVAVYYYMTDILPVRHVFFDYWLGSKGHEVTLDSALSLKSLDAKSEDFSFSVHSADPSAATKIKEILGADKYKTYVRGNNAVSSN